MIKKLSKHALSVATFVALLLPTATQAYTTPSPPYYTTPTYPSPARPAHIHLFEGISNKDIIQLEDGSAWRAATPNEALTAYSWRPTVRNQHGIVEVVGDRIVLTPNQGLFTSANYYPYYLNNQENGTYIRVEPVASPYHFGPESFWVFNTNHQLGYVYLDSGAPGRDLMTWEISGSYSHLLRQWEPNDHIVIGLYDGFLSFLSSYNFILINFNKGHFVQARPH